MAIIERKRLQHATVPVIAPGARVNLSGIGWSTILSLVLAVVALTLATSQSYQAVRQAKRLNEQSEKLQFVTDSLSTRYLGRFPDYIPHVIQLIDEANVDLRILAANPVPAFFTAPKLALDYANAVERKSRVVRVRLTCLNGTQRRRRLQVQFPTTPEKWSDWKPANQAQIEEFLRFWHPKFDADIDHQKFLELLTKVQQSLFKRAFQDYGVKVREVSRMIAVQAWIADESRAVFSIESSDEAYTEGLYTSDPKFVKALASMADLYDSA
jgi:hypothetical protein